MEGCSLNNGIGYHIYADDTQFYISFKCNNPLASLPKLNNCMSGGVYVGSDSDSDSLFRRTLLGYYAEGKYNTTIFKGEGSGSNI